MASGRARQHYCRCGTHLAKDNTERQCARCQRASRDKLITPPQVPPEFWQTDQFRDAFAAQHMGWVARAYRTHAHHYAVYGPGGISQTLLGQWLGLRQPKISEIETGPPIRDLDTLAYWARVLRIPAELLWFDLPGQTRQPVSTECDASIDSPRAEEGSLDLAALLKDLTADRLPVLGNGERSVGVSALEGASLASARRYCSGSSWNWTTSLEATRSTYRCHGMSRGSVSTSSRSRRTASLLLRS